MGKTVDTVSEKINAIRAANGNPMTKCPACGRGAATPFRVWDGDRVAYGCVDAFHTGRLMPGAGATWHARTEAKDIRRKTLAALKGTR